ncbi:MAG: hypothetical protein Q8P90_06210 [bacterium]|nr:hypothetical protein [bacterium]
MTVWTPNPLPHARGTELPDPQIYINTGNAEIRFSNDPRVLKLVHIEIDRQTRNQQKSTGFKLL